MHRRFTFYIHKGQNNIKLEEPLHISPNSRMVIRNLDVFWNFKNLEEEGVINYGSKVNFKPGYWDFDQIQKRVNNSGMTLTLNAYDSTCTIHGKDHKINMGTLGPLLGFKKNATIAKDTETKSGDTVNINNGVRFLTLSCNLVSFSRNFFNGNRSQNIVCIPITSTQKLFGTVSHLSNRYCSVPLYNGNFQEIGFFLDSNNRQNFNASVLIELEIY